MLASQDDIRIVGETANVADTLTMLRVAQPDVCILEIAMAGYCALRLVRAARNQALRSVTLVLSGGDERDFALRTIRAGASGYLSKDCTDLQLVDAVRTAADRRPYFSDTMCDLLVESLKHGHAGRHHEILSDADFEVLCLLVNGVPSARIATICSMTLAMVRLRRHKIMTLMALDSDAHLVAYALRNDLIETTYPSL